MATTINIELTDTQYKALEYAAFNVTEFLTNAANVRSQRAVADIVAQLITHCNANDIQLATGEAAQVDQAYSLEIIKTSKEQHDFNMANNQ